MADKLISTRVLVEARERVRVEVERQRAIRADGDPFFRHADWLLAEWEQAEREAVREYVSTRHAARLTGWSTETLRRRARRAHSGEGEPLPAEWAGLLVRRDGHEYSLVLSTVPLKPTQAAA
jgi:hypothetical protein